MDFGDPTSTGRPRISLVVAMAKNRVIGRENGLPWRLPGDLKRFRQITTGHTIIMGRKTFESIGKPLPNRNNIVITRQRDYRAEGATVVGSLDAAIEAAQIRAVTQNDEIFVIGGGEIYAQALSIADRIHLTQIDQEIEGDAYFPKFKMSDFKETSREDQTDPMPHSFLILDRVK